VSYKISSRQISKKSPFLAFYVRFFMFFSCFAGKNAFLDGFLVVFTVVRPLVWLLDNIVLHNTATLTGAQQW